jgi:hypothetical protein
LNQTLGGVESSYSRAGTFIASRLKPGGRIDCWNFNDKGTYIDPLAERLYSMEYSANAKVTPMRASSMA